MRYAPTRVPGKLGRHPDAPGQTPLPRQGPPASARLGLRKPRTYLCPGQKRSGWRSLNAYFSFLLTTPNYIILPL